MATKKSTKKPAKKSSSDLIDEQLERYRSMRDFSVTKEPSGGSKKAKLSNSDRESAQLPFVIQKHAASHLHYDFRLGWNGVLKSWAVAKGPSYNVKDKRLAVQVEDHPIDYGGFEGIIPKGQYGGGTVMLWDTGTWEPQPGHTDVDEGLRDGSLKFALNGTKMKGNWALVRMGGKAANASKPNWLLIKEHDSFERNPNEKCITDEAPNSVITDRSLEEIASNEDHVWNSKDTANGNAVEKRNTVNAAEDATQPASRNARGKKPSSASKPSDHAIQAARASIDVTRFPKEALPDFVAPQLALQSEKAPEREGWLHELKLDGYRVEARKEGAKVQLFTRSGLDWTHRMKEIAAEISKLPADKLLLDGEVVVLSDKGTTSFADLQASFREGEKHPLTYFVFDLLHLDGHNLRNETLVERKALLAELLSSENHPHETVRFSEHIESSGEAVFHHACQLDAEGIVSKRAASKYTSGRTGDWLKIKCVHEQEFVIGGFTLPSNGIRGVGALLLGYYDDGGKLIYAGRTGTGFTQKSHKLIRDQLEKIRSNSSMFASIPSEARRGAIWVTPTLVAQVGFATWTADRLVRQAAFKGLREDKNAKEVRREEPVDSPDAAVDSLDANTDAKHGSPAKSAANIVPADEKSAKAAPSKSASANAKFLPASKSKIESPTDAAARLIPLRLTHPNKILDLESQLTKQQLADYYWAIANHMLPQIAGRPLSLVRCPEGSTQPCFFQKHTNHTLPPGIESVDVPDKKTGKIEPYIALSTREALAGLAQMGVLEVHPWSSTNSDLEHPDRIIIDLDPDESIHWNTLAESAELVRILLKSLGLESFLKSTGGKGLHIVAPMEPEHEWGVIKQFAHAIAQHLERKQPSLYLSKMSKAARKGRIYVDYLRNERGATAVAAFSPRARAGAPVSVPLSWSELKGLERPVFHVADFEDWKSRLAQDPWKKLGEIRQRIDIDKVGQVLHF